MTDEAMTPSAQPLVVSGQMSAADVTALVTLFSGMLDAMERRIINRLDQNATGASERWKAHEKEHTDADKRLCDMQDLLSDHLNAERDEDLIAQARVAPVKTAFGWFVGNWRTVMLFIFAALAIVGFIGDAIHGMLP